MAQFEVYRSMHTVRGGPAKPAQTFELSEVEDAALREIGFDRRQAWALDRLGILLEELSARLQLLRSDIIQAICRDRALSALPEHLRPAVEERMLSSPRVRALRLALAAGRAAAIHQMTLVHVPSASE